MILSIRETFPDFWYTRRIFDINTFKRIQKIEEIEDDKHYIITGKELLRKDQAYRTVPEEVKKIAPMVIHVYPNGDGLSLPNNIRVTYQKFPTFEKLIRFIDEKVHLITGCIKILYNMSGKKITSIDQLENEQEYVAASYNEPFINIKYNINSYKKHRRRYTYYRSNNTLDENKNANEENNNRCRTRCRTVSVGKVGKTSQNEATTPKRNHSRSFSDYKDINKEEPNSLRKVKTEQGSGLRSSLKSSANSSRSKTDLELKSCLSKTKSKEKANVVIDSNPNIFEDGKEPKRILSPSSSRSRSQSQSRSHSRAQSATKEEDLKQFTSEATNTNHDLAMPRKSDD